MLLNLQLRNLMNKRIIEQSNSTWKQFLIQEGIGTKHLKSMKEALSTDPLKEEIFEIF